MATCVPIKELKNTGEFTSTVLKSQSPVIVTKNGKEVFVAMTMESYESLKLEIARAELHASVAKAEANYSEGRFVEARSAIAAIGAKYGL